MYVGVNTVAGGQLAPPLLPYSLRIALAFWGLGCSEMQMVPTALNCWLLCQIF